MNQQFGNLEKYYNVKSALELGPLADSIADCVASAFQGGVTIEDTMNHISGDVVMVYREPDSSKVNAFSAIFFDSPNKTFDTNEISFEQGVYFAAATVRREMQGTGLYRAMNRERIGEALTRQNELIFTRTQNPRVQAGIEATLEELLNEGEIRAYSTERLKVEGVYGRMLTREMPKSSRVSFDDLNLTAGDAYLLLFRLNY